MLLQVVPVAQIGKALSQNQWTEEIPVHTDAEVKGDGDIHGHHPYVPPLAYTTIVSSFNEGQVLAYLHHVADIPTNHSTEVVAPPPDQA